jgi:hypothetical protein
VQRSALLVRTLEAGMSDPKKILSGVVKVVVFPFAFVWVLVTSLKGNGVSTK